MLERPGVLRFAVEPLFPCRRIVVVKFLALRRKPLFNSLAHAPLNDFLVAKFDPAVSKLVWMADVLRAERHFVVASFVLAFDKLQQLLVPFRCCEKGIGFLFVCRRQVVRLDHDLFCHDYALSFWRRKAVASPLPLGAAKLVAMVSAP